LLYQLTPPHHHHHHHHHFTSTSLSLSLSVATTGRERFGEPPASGYTKSNGNLVLETGEVVDSRGHPLKEKEVVQEIVFEDVKETEEERRERLLANRPR
jgi:hypothetical protein